VAVVMIPKPASSTIVGSPINIPQKKYKMVTENVNVYYGNFLAVKNISIKFPEKSVTALIGPSGCGKTTFLRCLNRMHDMTKSARVEGKVMIDNIDLYDRA